MNNKKLVEQIVDRLVNEVIYTGNVAGSLEVNGSIAQSVETFKTSLVAKLTTGAPDGAIETVTYQRKTILTDAQIKTLPTVFVEVVPAPGENKMILLHNAMIRSNQISGIYTGSDVNINMFIAYSDGSDGWRNHASNPFAFNISDTDRFSLLTGAISAYTIPANSDIWPPYISDSFTTSFNNIGLVLVLDNTVNLTGGHVDNSLEVTVFYSIIDL